MLFPERLVFDFEVNRVAEFHAAQTATAPLRSHWEIRVGLLRYSLHVMSEGTELFPKKQENNLFCGRTTLRKMASAHYLICCMGCESGTLFLIRLRVLPDMAVVKIEGAISPTLQSSIVRAVHAECDIWRGIAFGKRDDILPAA